MSQHDDFDRSLARWFDAEAHPAATADVLDRALRATRQRRPRPRLFAALGSHWVGDNVGPTSGGATLWRTDVRTSTALVVLLLVLALVAGAVLVGARLLQPAPVDLGIFAPVAGRIVYGDEQGIWGVDATAPADPATKVQLTSEAGTPIGWSRDGARLLIMRETPLRRLLFVLHADGSETQVTESPMSIPSATISPDGSRVGSVGGAVDFDFYTVDLSGAAEVRVEGLVWGATFSPGGTRIAYVVGAGDHSNSVWLMDADGSDAHPIVSNESDVVAAGHVRGVAWSPAGDRIALGLGGKLYTFATDGSDFTQIAGADRTCGPADPCAVKLPRSAESPYWSPDGSQIAYTTGCVEGAGSANRAGCHLAIADADGSNVREFSYGMSGPWHPGVPAIDEPAQSPETTEPAVPSITRLDGEVLRFTGEQSNGIGDLIAVHAETGETRVLLEDLRDIASASWSADGRWIAYKNTSGLLSVVGSDRLPRQLTGGGLTGEAVGRPWSWSPDGARLAVGGFIFDASTGKRTDIEAGVVWSPDGTRLLSGASGGSIYSDDVRTGGRSLLVQLPGEDLETVDGIEWSPDGSRLAILNDLNPGFHRLFVLNADGSDIRVLAEDAAVEGWDWSPDGTRLAFAESSDPELRIWVAPVNGSTATLVGSQPNQDEGGDPVWSHDGLRIAFWTEPGEAFVIDADGSGGVAPLDALTYEDWRGGWFECGTCLSFRPGF